MSHFSEKKFLTPLQHGFRSKHSCESQLLITTDEFIENFESKTQTDVVVLDFSKAFDFVPHQCLLHKLDHYGIRGTTLNWIQNFPTNRTQKVVVDGSSSESARVRSGVPQGTVLRPLLFLSYINDLPSMVSSQVRQADQEQLQRDLSALQDWADRWGMCVNPTKCSVLRVCRPKSKNLEFKYTLKGETLMNVSSTPYLGVSWNGRPTLTELQVKQIPLWASFVGTWRHVPLN